MSELNISLQYLPLTKEIKDVSKLNNNDIWIEQSDQDQFENPRFKINEKTSCTIQTSKNGKWYVAFVRISEQNENGGYNNSYFKSFAERKDYNETNNPVFFNDFQEWIKDELTGAWVRKDSRER